MHLHKQSYCITKLCILIRSQSYTQFFFDSDSNVVMKHNCIFCLCLSNHCQLLEWLDSLSTVWRDLSMLPYIMYLNIIFSPRIFSYPEVKNKSTFPLTWTERIIMVWGLKRNNGSSLISTFYSTFFAPSCREKIRENITCHYTMLYSKVTLLWLFS